jgi:hypothetical protein
MSLRWRADWPTRFAATGYEEAEDDADLQQDPDRLEDLVGLLPERLEDLRGGLGGEGPPAVLLEREDAGVDLGAAVEQQRPDDVEDHEEHEPGGSGVRAVEP